MAEAKQSPLVVYCHCRKVKVTAPALREKVCECLCGVCRRYGALWAYYKPEEVQIEGEEHVEGYAHGPKKISFNRCKTCGNVLYYSVLRNTEPRIAVNCRMLEEREEYAALDSYESDGD